MDFSLKTLPPQYNDDKKKLEAWKIGRSVADLLWENESDKVFAEAREREERKLNP